MSYTRFFMPLEKEATGYEFKGRNPSGRCVVESRGTSGKLTVWAQDLKPETRYGIYIIFADEGRYAGVSMGSLSVDTKGKAEARRDIDEQSLNGFQIADALAVAVTAADAPGVVSPLCGYRDRPFSWRSSFYVSTGEVEKIEPKVVEIPVPEPMPEPEPIPEPEPVVTPEPEPVAPPEPDEAPEPEPEIETVPEPEPEPEPEIETPPMPKPEPIIDVESISKPEEAPSPAPDNEPEPEAIPEPAKPRSAPKARKPKGAKPTSRRAMRQELQENSHEDSQEQDDN